MARPCRWRRICTEPEFDRFVPEGIPSPESITLTVDEYEAVRLIDRSAATAAAETRHSPRSRLQKKENIS